MPTESDLSSRTGLSRDQVLADVKRIIAEHMEMAAERIRDGDDLERDVGCDSLDVVEIVMEIEEHFDVTVPDEAAQDARTVVQVADAVVALLGG